MNIMNIVNMLKKKKRVEFIPCAHCGEPQGMDEQNKECWVCDLVKNDWKIIES